MNQICALRLLFSGVLSPDLNRHFIVVCVDFIFGGMDPGSLVSLAGSFRGISPRGARAICGARDSPGGI